MKACSSILLFVFLSSCPFLLFAEPAATVNGEPISVEEFARFTIHWKGYMILQMMINNKLVEQEAKRKGIAVSEDDIQRQLYVLRNQHPSKEAFGEFLKTSHLTEKNLLVSTRNQCLREKLLKEYVHISEEDAQKFYEENKLKLYETGRCWKLKELCVETQEEAEEILAQIENGESFEEMAKAHSMIPSATNGGNVGWVEEGIRGLKLERGFRRLQPGEVSKPLPSPQGYYLFLVSENKEHSVKSFEEVKEDAMRRAERAAKAEAYGELIEKLRKDAHIEVLLWPDTQ